MSTKSARLSARLPEDVAKSLAAYAKLHRVSTSEAAVRLLDEALRVARHPGIDFRWTPTGRRAFVTGTGLAVWEFWMIWSSHGKSAPRLRKAYPRLTADQISAGVGYIETYARETQDECEAATTFDPRLHPGVTIVRV